MWCICAAKMVFVSGFLFKLLCKCHLTKMATMTLEIGSRSPIFELNPALQVLHLCCKYGVRISFCFYVIAQTSLYKLLRKCHLTKMATMTFEICWRSPIFELNLALNVVHLCCKDGVRMSFCNQVIAQTSFEKRTDGRLAFLCPRRRHLWGTIMT